MKHPDVRIQTGVRSMPWLLVAQQEHTVSADADHVYSCLMRLVWVLCGMRYVG
jgi:hypothetical protein